jgi:hypothetical protein
MLYWENEFPGHGVVHHYAVLCYYLQHPSLYSREGLAEGLNLLRKFSAGATTQQTRAANRDRVDSGKREFKISARPGNQGTYAHPPAWRMRAADVIAAGPEAYIESVNAWARTCKEDLERSGNL